MFDIILVTWNRPEYTKRTIASLIDSGAYRDCQRFIIVDNHSTEEGMAEFLEDMSHYAKTFILRRPQNDGWGSAVNDALGISRAEYLMILNNDVEFLPGFHQKMLTVFDVLGDTQSIGILAGWRHTAHGGVVGGVHNDFFDELDNVPAVCWLLPKEAMEKVGMLPEHGPCETRGGNGEDTGYAMEMKAHGFLVGATAEDVATHIDGY